MVSKSYWDVCEQWVFSSFQNYVSCAAKSFEVWGHPDLKINVARWAKWVLRPSCSWGSSWEQLSSSTNYLAPADLWYLMFAYSCLLFIIQDFPLNLPWSATTLSTDLGVHLIGTRSLGSYSVRYKFYLNTRKKWLNTELFFARGWSMCFMLDTLLIWSWLIRGLSLFFICSWRWCGYFLSAGKWGHSIHLTSL